MEDFEMEVDDSDYVSAPGNWDGAAFDIKEQKRWDESVYRCYTNPPKAELKKRFRFVWKIDCKEEKAVKKDAAIHALGLLMEKFDDQHRDLPSQDNVRHMVQSQGEHFLCSLRTFHPLTMHLKVKDFTKHYPNATIFVCPFGDSAEKWRQFYSVEYITEGKAAESCGYHGETNLTELKNHIDSYIGNFGFHEAAMDYLRYCEEHLPKVAQYVVVKDKDGITIRSVRSPTVLADAKKKKNLSTKKSTDDSPPVDEICFEETSEIPKRSNSANEKLPLSKN